MRRQRYCPSWFVLSFLISDLILTFSGKRKRNENNAPKQLQTTKDIKGEDSVITFLMSAASVAVKMVAYILNCISFLESNFKENFSSRVSKIK